MFIIIIIIIIIAVWSEGMLGISLLGGVGCDRTQAHAEVLLGVGAIVRRKNMFWCSCPGVFFLKSFIFGCGKVG